MDNFLQLIFKTENERKKAIYFILSMTLSTVIACKIYGRLFGSFEIMPLSDYSRIVTEFFFTGQFVVCLMILIVVHKIFYAIVDFFLFKRFAKYADKLYDFFRHRFNKDELLADLKTSKVLQWIANWAINHFKELSVIDIDKDELKPGINFYNILIYFRKLNDTNDKETHIDTTLSYFPFAITVQILILFDFVAIDHISFSNAAIITINVATLLLLLLQLLVYFVNIFADLKQDKILKVLERLEKEHLDRQAKLNAPTQS